MPKSIKCFTGFFAGRSRRPTAQSALTSSPTSDYPSSPTVYDGPSPHEYSKESPPGFVSYGGPCACCGAITTGRKGSLPLSTQDPPQYDPQDAAIEELFPPEVRNTVDSVIQELDPDLRQLSLDIWSHPELGYEEFAAHDRLTAFMESHGFVVTRHYLGLETAWRAEYTHGSLSSPGPPRRTIGLQSEMDALPNIGHACGHNLIAISGVAVAIGLKNALEHHDVSARIILLGTPAEEHGGGKIKLLERGAYKEMDVCLMTHPGPGPRSWTTVQPWIALQSVEVEFFGHSAHASYSPWEAQNALDAAFMAYSGIAVMRQQMKPTCRVHGIVIGKDWQPNVIPDYSKMRWVIRAPTWPELEVLRGRVIACFEAAAHATGCKVTIQPAQAYKNCMQNDVLGEEYTRISKMHYGLKATMGEDLIDASTDFGDISYALPSIQSVFSIPTVENGSNHTPQFTEAARAPEAHEMTLTISKALAMTAFRVIQDDAFFHRVRQAYEQATVTSA